MRLIFFALFFLDILLWVLFQQWIFSSLFVATLVGFLLLREERSVTGYLWWPFFLLLLEDTVKYNRWGVGLVYLLPTFVAAALIRRFLNPQFPLFSYVLLTSGLLMESLLIKNWLFGLKLAPLSTIVKILLNLLLCLLARATLGTRGDRS